MSEWCSHILDNLLVSSHDYITLSHLLHRLINELAIQMQLITMRCCVGLTDGLRQFKH